MEDITLNTLKNAKKSIEQFLLSEGVVSDNYEASSEAAIILCEIHNCKKTDILFQNVFNFKHVIDYIVKCNGIILWHVLIIN